MAKLSNKSEMVIDEFDKAAQDWGWVMDQGSADNVKTSEEDYDVTKEALIKRVLYLENKIKRLTK